MNTISRILGEDKRPPTELELRDPVHANLYAKYVINRRFPEGEAVIAKDPHWSKEYLKEFPEAKLDWFAKGWIDWTGL